MSAGDCLRLDSAEALSRATSVRMLARVFLPRFEVPAEALGPDEARAAQERIDRLVDACGCGEGAAATMLAGGAWVAWVLGPGIWPGLGGAAWRFFLVLFAGATAGKVFGLVRARFALRRELRALAPLMPAPVQLPASAAFVG